MIRVIGLGSPFGDDRAGWQVVEQLRGRVPAAIQLVTLDRPGAALLNWFEGVDHLVLIDAVREAPAGRVLTLEVDDIAALSDPVSSHQLALDQCVKLARTLDCLPSEIEIFGVTIEDIEQPTELVDETCAALASRLSALLGQLAA